MLACTVHRGPTGDPLRGRLEGVVADEVLLVEILTELLEDRDELSLVVGGRERRRLIFEADNLKALCTLYFHFETNKLFECDPLSTGVKATRAAFATRGVWRIDGWL